MQAYEYELLRELAKQYREISEHPANAERIRRSRMTHSLKPTRPLVWVDEVPWHEMNVNDELTIRCEDERARQMELFLRKKIYQWKHFQCDMVAEPFYRVYKSFSTTGNGLKIEEHKRVTDDTNNIYSHGYIDQLASMDDLERMHLPVITAHPEDDKANVAFAEEVLGGILPVKLSADFLYCPPWDDIAMLRGMEPMLMDLICEEELMHATIKKFTECFNAVIDQRDALGLFDNDISALHCTPGYCDELDAIADGGQKWHAASSWYRGMAQPFSSVSPEMFEEYEVEYILPLAKRFGFTYYGCCEPLHDRMDKIERIPNLRKVGVSPWANIEMSAERMGGKYVFARKPNPAAVAETVNEDAVRKEIRETMDAVMKYNCPTEFVLKDISTVSYKPENLTKWVDIVESTIDEYY